ncbi:PREDICTED: craniofacial development protein 2-like [Branchiostoma belcheri]|uniref:Craniofacial development protein 2-like n=1 Tax=Branchiostoma belcheri TaxID=7741 RepID=A0A6P4XUQ3_BRABE|nr:PREDICTED: craniofacial development protein 2-like [Branchiostoma belcheri]
MVGRFPGELLPANSTCTAAVPDGRYRNTGEVVRRASNPPPPTSNTLATNPCIRNPNRTDLTGNMTCDRMDLRVKPNGTEMFRVATWNVLSMNREGSAELVANELTRLSITVAGLTEVRWPGTGTHTTNDYSFLWSGREDGQHRQGVALGLALSASRALVYWKPVSNRLLLARLRHTFGMISVIVAYAPTDMADDEEKDEFYTQLAALVSDISRHDIIWILGEFNATTGTDRTGFETALGSHGNQTRNNNGSRLLEFCSNHSLRTERSFFPHKTIHCMTWISNDGHTRKELDHILTSQRWHTSTDVFTAVQCWEVLTTDSLP